MKSIEDPNPEGLCKIHFYGLLSWKLGNVINDKINTSHLTSNMQTPTIAKCLSKCQVLNQPETIKLVNKYKVYPILLYSFFVWIESVNEMARLRLTFNVDILFIWMADNDSYMRNQILSIWLKWRSQEYEFNEVKLFYCKWIIHQQYFFSFFDKIESNWLLNPNYYFTISLILMIEQNEIIF